MGRAAEEEEAEEAKLVLVEARLGSRLGRVLGMFVVVDGGRMSRSYGAGDAIAMMVVVVLDVSHGTN